MSRTPDDSTAHLSCTPDNSTALSCTADNSTAYLSRTPDNITAYLSCTPDDGTALSRTPDDSTAYLSRTPDNNTMSLTSDVKGGTHRQCLSLQTKIREKVQVNDVSHYIQLRVETAEKLLEISNVSQIRHTFLGITRKLTAIDDFWVVRWKEGTKTHLPRRERSPRFFPFGRCALSGL